MNYISVKLFFKQLESERLANITVICSFPPLLLKKKKGSQGRTGKQKGLESCTLLLPGTVEPKCCHPAASWLQAQTRIKTDNLNPKQTVLV